MMMQSCDSTRSRCEPARMAFTDLWEGCFPLGSVPAGLTVRFQAAGNTFYCIPIVVVELLFSSSFPGFLLMLLSDGGLSAE